MKTKHPLHLKNPGGLNIDDSNVRSIDSGGQNALGSPPSGAIACHATTAAGAADLR